MICLCRTQLAEILSDDGHDVHMLISDSYDHFEHRDDQTRHSHMTLRHRCSVTFTDHSLPDDTVNSVSSCSRCNDTSQSRYAEFYVSRK